MDFSTFPCGPSHYRPYPAVPKQLLNPRRKPFRISRGGQEPGDAVLNQFRNTPYGGGHNWHAASRSFHQADRHSLVVAGEHTYGRALPEFQHLVLVGGAGHFDAVVEALV